MRRIKTLLSKTNKNFAYSIIPRTGDEILDRFKDYNVPMKLDKISEILSEPDIIKDRKLSGKKVRENGEKKTIYS